MKQDDYDPTLEEAGTMTGMVLRHVAPEKEGEAEELMRELMQVSRRYAGYLGTEIFPPVPGVQDGFVVIYRYESADLLRDWLQSEDRRRLLARLDPLLDRPAVEFHFTSRRRDAGTVSTVLAYHVKPAYATAFADWRRRIYQRAREQPGFLGTESFNTLEDGEPVFIAVVRFDSRAHLDAWLDNPERAGLLEECQQYIEDVQVRRVSTGFEGWFSFGPEARRQSPPARWRQWLMILGVLYPVIMTLKIITDPLFGWMPMPVAFLLLLVIDVFILTYFIMPHFSRLLNFWLRPAPDATWRTEALGLLIIGGLIGASLLIFLPVFGFPYW